jgi:bifunctional DNA-binding transcriptional regulator/antitoxin component of YhaV-PrlF toxin-antitoxin module
LLYIQERILGAAMDELTVTATGQITLSEELLDHLGVSSGQRVSVEKLPGGRIEMRAAGPMGKISDTFGCLKREGQPTLSIEEIQPFRSRK